MKTPLRHPPFRHGDGKGTKAEYCTKEGAQKLAGMIEAAWARVGYTIRTEIVRVIHAGGDDRADVYSVRMPDLVNGLPLGVPRNA